MLSILVVDDQPAFRQAMKRLLRRQSGLRLLDTASNGQEAIEKASTLQPDVVLIDLRMPVMSGLKAIPRLRSLLPDAAIIVVTVVDEEAHRIVSADQGADAFVDKTDLMEELPQVIERVVRERQLAKEQQQAHPRVFVRRPDAD